MAIVGVVGAEFAYSVRLEATAVRAYKDRILASHLAEAAFAQAVREIVAESSYVTFDEHGLLTFYRQDRLPLPQLPREKVDFEGGQYSYRITDEEARINLNASPPTGSTASCSSVSAWTRACATSSATRSRIGATPTRSTGSTAPRATPST